MRDAEYSRQVEAHERSWERPKAYAVLRVHPWVDGSDVFPGVHGAVDPRRTISNSAVKRCSADDIGGEAP